MNRTSIEWVKNPDGSQGFTWNPIVGCSRGCPYCYARRIATTRLAHTCPKCAIFEPHLHPERLDEPLKRKKPSGIFVCSMGELFDPLLSLGAVKHVLALMDANRRHRFYVLSKQATIDLFWFPRNIWLGVSCEGRDTDRLLMSALEKTATPGKHFVSYEPLLGQVVPKYFRYFDWIIIGAQTGPNAIKPKREWVTDIIAKADAAGIPVFCKNNLLETYTDLPQRQEVPE